MGFYGNITNVANTTFQFDKIYSNRVEMESHCNSDGIMVGRYVLVEYDNDAAYPVIYTNDGKFYSSPGYEEATRIKFLNNTDEHDGFHLNEIGQVQVNTSNDQGIIISTSIDFYRCTGQDGDYAVFVKIDEPNTSNYIVNFSIDEAQYSNGKSFRGYDSTVWVKTSDNNGNSITTHYVNIADLNSVVPTFGIAADAPTMSPIIPHFDADSTNVYYKLHIQPTYGLRVGKGSGSSDGETYWTRENYNPATGSSTNEYWNAAQNKWVTYTDEKQIQKFAGDIYFNKDAFDWEPDKNGIIHKTVKGDDVISILPTGESGNTYYDHNSKTNKTAKDIQEIKVSLPSIGNMMSDAWDIIHGPNRDNARTDENSSLQGRLNSIDDLERNQIPIKRTSDGTIVGTKINGGNQKVVEENQILLENLSTAFDGDDAWIRTEINAKDENGDQCIAIHHTYHPDSTNYDIASNLNSDKVESTNSEIDTIQLYTPKIDNAGHVVGKSINTITLPYGYKTIKTNGREDDEDKQTENASSLPTIDDVVADNTQDELTINSGNKWIRIDTNKINDSLTISHDIHNFATTENDEIDLNEDIMSRLSSIDFSATGTEELLKKYRDMKILGVDSNTIIIPDWDYDKAGHITDKHSRKYTLPYGYKTISVKDNSASVGVPYSQTGDLIAEETQDTLELQSSNKWIRIDGGSFDHHIKIGHQIQATDFANTYYAATIEQEDGTTTHNQIPKFGDEVKILNISVDNAGHVTGFGRNAIKIPHGSYSSASAATGSEDIITSISFDESSGKISSTKATTNTLKITNYKRTPEEGDDLSIIANETSINSNFAAIEKYIDNLTLDSADSTGSLITDVAQVNGQVTIAKKNSENITLTNYSKLTTLSNQSITSTETLNNAFGKLEYRLEEEIDKRKEAIEKEETARDKAIATAIAEIVNADEDGKINKLAEVIEWINNNPSTATEMQAAINNLDDLVGSTSVSIQIDDKISALNLGEIVTHDSEEFATAEQGTLAETANNKIAELENEINDLKTANTNLQATINALTARIEALEPTTE